MTTPSLQAKLFYTVAEAAQLLQIGPATLYRAIREDAFPAVKIRGRCIIPGRAIEAMIDEATTSGRCVDVTAMMEQRRQARMAAMVAKARW